MKTKKCSNCFKIKPVSEFYTRRQSDGFQSRCKSCNTEVCAGYRERLKLEVLGGVLESGNDKQIIDWRI